MAATPSVKVLKTFGFKGGSRVFSNRYHFNGGTPADAAHWHTLMDAIVAAEKLVHSSGVQIVECIGYNAGSDVPAASKVYATNGTMAPGANGALAPGECAKLVRWSTAARTTKNHPIYLFSYYHEAHYDNRQSDADYMGPIDLSTLQTYAAAWISGFSDGAITAVRASPNGAAATGYVVEEFLTHRDFPYSTSV